MSSLFPVIEEQRYSQYPRRYSNEYHVDGRTKAPDGKGACATLASARKHATAAIDLGFCHTVRVFDRKIGQYVYTYKQTVAGISRQEGFVK